jgi:hypothetical protein
MDTSEDRARDVEVGEKTWLWRSLSDPIRQVTSLWPSPSGCVLAAADQLGRILLLDAPTFCAMQIWKVKAKHPLAICH